MTELFSNIVTADWWLLRDWFDWLLDQSIDWLIDWFDWLIDWLFDWLMDWLNALINWFDWLDLHLLIDCSIDCLIDCLIEIWASGSLELVVFALPLLAFALGSALILAFALASAFGFAFRSLRLGHVWRLPPEWQVLQDKTDKSIIYLNDWNKWLRFHATLALCLFFYLPDCLVCLSICLSVCMSVCLNNTNDGQLD